MMETFKKIMALFMSLFMSFLVSVGLAAPQDNNVSNLSYGSEASQVMDIYLPTGAEQKQSNSAVLLLHNGMFTSGSKSDLKSTCESIANRGYIAVALDYRLLNADQKAVTVFSILDDLTLAIRALKDYSTEKKLNINKIALAGDSAGGYYALMYAYSRIIYSPITISFVASRVAPADMAYSQWKDFYKDQQYVDLVNLMAGTSYKTADINSSTSSFSRTVLYLSPVYYLNRSSVPTLFAYAPNDNVVPFANKDSLERNLTACGVAHDYIEYSSATHDLGNVWNTLLNTADFSDLLTTYCEKYFS